MATSPLACRGCHVGQDIGKSSFTALLALDAKPNARRPGSGRPGWKGDFAGTARLRSEEHTSELQSLRHLVCRLLLSTLYITPLSLHDALRIYLGGAAVIQDGNLPFGMPRLPCWTGYW